MSKLSQRDAMINYFNSLLSEELEDEQEQNLSSKKNLEVSPSTEPVLQPKLQDEEVVQAKPFAEKPNKKQALQALLTAALPDTRTETATVTDTAIATENKTQVETVVENKVETEQQTEVAIDTATKEEVLTQEATVTEVATAQETTTETATEPTVQTATNVTEVVDTAIATATATATDTVVSHVEVQAPVVEEQVAVATAPTPAPTPVWQNIETKEEFTALFFKVAGVTFAVPLINLGGIYEPGNITSIFGKPAWYMGLMQLNDRKISVVDTQKWMLPDIPSAENREYKYIIMLDKSDWCIGCDELIGTKNITRSAVKWRATPGARPWLAGIVKDEMCVLIHVMELIKLYQNGLDMSKE